MNHWLWTSVADIPQPIREAAIWRLTHFGQLEEVDLQRLRELCGAGHQAVQQIFENERIRWTVRHLAIYPQFYDFAKPEAICPKCGANQKEAPAKPKPSKKEKAAIQIEENFDQDVDAEGLGEDGVEEALGITGARSEGVDPGDLNMDDYDE